MAVLCAAHASFRYRTLYCDYESTLASVIGFRDRNDKAPSAQPERIQKMTTTTFNQAGLRGLRDSADRLAPPATNFFKTWLKRLMEARQAEAERAILRYGADRWCDQTERKVNERLYDSYRVPPLGF